MSINAVIFDFNGVLVDDESVHFRLFSEVLATEGVNLSQDEYVERYLGYDDRKCFEAVLLDSGRSVEAPYIDRLVAQKAKRYTEVASEGLRFFPAAREALGNIAARWPVAICSGALRAEIEYSLKLLDRFERVTVIISAEDTTNCKPHPEGYQLALAALRNHANKAGENAAISSPLPTELAPINCLVIEDSLAGIISAKSAGMWAVGVPNTYSAQQLLNSGADDVVLSLRDLTPSWIERRFAS